MATKAEMNDLYSDYLGARTEADENRKKLETFKDEARKEVRKMALAILIAGKVDNCKNPIDEAVAAAATLYEATLHLSFHGSNGEAL